MKAGFNSRPYAGSTAFEEPSTAVEHEYAKEPRVRITVDQEACCSAGNCVFTAPQVFDQDDDGLVVALLTTVPPELEAKVQQAADLCPSSAISVLED